jgi:hypothetical protein
MTKINDLDAGLKASSTRKRSFQQPLKPGRADKNKGLIGTTEVVP